MIRLRFDFRAQPLALFPWPWHDVSCSSKEARLRITERQPGDIAELEVRAAAERDALRRDRYRAVLLALEGEEAAEIAEELGRARRSVQDWVYAYRDGGVNAVQPKRRKGREPKLPREREAELLARLDAGPTDADGGVCTLRGKDVVRILEREFLVKYTLAGAYELLERLGYSCLAPRPRHEKGDPAAQEQFRAEAPLLSKR
jgi:transposase